MKFVPAKCPNCQGDLQIPDDRDFIKCMYCGGDIKVREVISVKSDYSTEIKLWKSEAENKMKHGKYYDAIEIYDKIIVIDSLDETIYIKKGIAYLSLIYDEPYYFISNSQTSNFNDICFGIEKKNSAIDASYSYLSWYYFNEATDISCKEYVNEAINSFSDALKINKDSSEVISESILNIPCFDLFTKEVGLEVWITDSTIWKREIDGNFILNQKRYKEVKDMMDYNRRQYIGKGGKGILTYDEYAVRSIPEVIGWYLGKIGLLNQFYEITKSQILLDRIIIYAKTCLNGIYYTTHATSKSLFGKTKIDYDSYVVQKIPIPNNIADILKSYLI